jgi:hypothetical protein
MPDLRRTTPHEGCPSFMTGTASAWSDALYHGRSVGRGFKELPSFGTLPGTQCP